MKIEPRPLAADERAILDHLLSLEFEGVEQLRRQAAEATVVGRCDCGCPTIEIETTASALAVPLEGRLAPIEGRVLPIADEPSGDVILFVDDGRLSSLELVWYTETPAEAWPPVARVELFRRPV
jgi:hypothetical protein